MPFLVTLALGWKWPGWAARLFGWAIPSLAAGALIVAGIMSIYHRGTIAGRAKVEARAAAAHGRAIAEARSDERKAAAVAATIDRRVTDQDDRSTALARSAITEIHDDLASAPKTPVAGNTAGAVFDTDGVRTSLDRLVDGANRAADAADAER